MPEKPRSAAPAAGEPRPAHANPASGSATVRAPVAFRRDPFKYLLLLRFLLVNILGVTLLGVAAAQGWVGMVFGNDPTRLTIVICIVFVFGLALCAWKIFHTSRGLNEVRVFDPASPGASEVTRYVEAVRDRTAQSRGISASALRQKYALRIATVRHVASSLVFLGLIGTVIGFIIALSGIQPDSVSEVGNILPMVSTLVRGMSVALYTTLVGAVLSIWLMVNYRLLATGTVTLANAIIELGEVHARA